MSPKKTSKKKEKKELKLVLVKWLDAYSYYGGSVDKETFTRDSEDEWIIYSPGFLMVDNEDYIALAGSWIPETFTGENRGHSDKFKELHNIPRAYIKSITVLKEFDCVAFNDSDIG